LQATLATPSKFVADGANAVVLHVIACEARHLLVAPSAQKSPADPYALPG
jgi:hypothetical protein